MFLEIIDWKTIEKFCDMITCGLHFDSTLKLNHKKCDKKCDDQW